MRISYQKLLPAVLAYCCLPLAVFVLGWVRPLIGVPALALIVAGWFGASGRTLPQWCKGLCLFGNTSERPSPLELVLGKSKQVQVGAGTPSNSELVMGRGAFALVCCAMVAWCFLGGQGGMWYQSDDWGMRNAIYRDLVTRSWPVYYLGGSAAMSYYIGHWLPPALVGKVLYKLGLSLNVVWRISNLLLLAWTSLGMVLVALLVLVTLRATRGRDVLLSLAMLVFFSTPDIIGIALNGRWSAVASVLHLEWWCGDDSGSIGQYSSITTCLFWVFNQSVVPWLCTLCFANERSFRSYFFLWACCLFCGPFPAVGLAGMMLMHGVATLAKTRGRDRAIRDVLCGVLTPQNVASIALAVLIGFFFLTNSAVGAGASFSARGNLLPPPLWFPRDPTYAAYAMEFIAIEGLLLPLLLWCSGTRHRALLLYVAVPLVLCPFVRVGTGMDFCMRASVPALFCLYLLCAERVLKLAREGIQHNACVVLLVVVLIAGVATPVMEFYRGFYHVANYGVEASQPDSWSVETNQDFTVTNFGFLNPQSSVFYHYLARHRA